MEKSRPSQMSFGPTAKKAEYFLSIISDYALILLIASKNIQYEHLHTLKS